MPTSTRSSTGPFMKPETFQLMKRKRTYLTPTLMASEWVMQKMTDIRPPFRRKEHGDQARSENIP